MKIKTYYPYIIFFLLLSVGIFIFNIYFINFSIDTILLFLSSKLFLGKWLSKGVFPLFNPYIFAGIPFAFDVGLGNFHPFNLLFLFPYPFSFALWTSLFSLLFLSGFFLFFNQFSKKKFFSVILTLMLFFSGSGFWRNNNPMIFVVIAHYGFFLFSLKYLKRSSSTSYLFPFCTGILMTLSGHIQFVLYGYILGIIFSIFFYQIPIKKIIFYYTIVLLFVSWYYVLSIPLSFESTRITSQKDYSLLGYLRLPHLIQLFFPLFFGYIKNGSRWNVGPTYFLCMSILFVPIFLSLLIGRKIRKALIGIFIIILASCFGIINLPFFRGASQSLIIIQIASLALFAQNRKYISNILIFSRFKTGAYISIAILSMLFLFFRSTLFSSFFFYLYTIVKKTPPNLFFDTKTVMEIGNIFAKNILLWMILSIFLLCIQFFKKRRLELLLLFIIFEGIYLNYFTSYFVSQSVLTKQVSLPSQIDFKNYRVQTASDVIPYFGFQNYFSDIFFRPPFSKEPTIFTKSEQKHSFILKDILSYIPSSRVMVQEIKAIQGYNTFVPKNIADFFLTPSSDYKTEYAYIIQRNKLFGEIDKGLHINGIETSRLTLYDPRWQSLGVRYFISNKPLHSYKLIFHDNRYFYENEKTESIYRIQDNNLYSVKKEPLDENPNRFIFQITKKEIGKKLLITVNPKGFYAKLNDKNIKMVKKNFIMEIPLITSGKLVVTYSPLVHFKEFLALSHS